MTTTAAALAEAPADVSGGEAVEQWREGDVFRWSYADEGPDDRRSYGRYHCCSMIGIVRANGRLYDTFWGSGSENRSFGPEQRGLLKLTYLGNLAEFEPRRKYEGEYYADSDIMDLSHSNSSLDNFFVRKGAKRCAAKMLASAGARLEEAEREERFARHKADRCREVIARLHAGEIDNVYL